MTATPEFTVTPWEVKGRVDYEELVKRFGTHHVTPQILAQLEKIGGPLPIGLRRGHYYSHRDLPWALAEHEKGNKITLYTGRGPSGHTHIGHLIPMRLTAWLQQALDVPVLLQLTDDEKFLFKDSLTLAQAQAYAKENMLDILAAGLDPKKTRFLVDTQSIKQLYPLSLEVAKRVTFSTAKAVFGFENDTNIGSIFFTSVQSAPAFLPSYERGKPAPVLIPCGIDQDPHFRVTRDVAPKLGYPKPALLHGKMAPSLLGPDAKMSASDPSSTIYTTDEPDKAAKKVMKAFTGGRATVQEQREKGGDPDVCSVCQFLAYLFEDDDAKLTERFRAYRAGEILDGENKQYLAEKVKTFLTEHQRKREQMRPVVEKLWTEAEHPRR